MRKEYAPMISELAVAGRMEHQIQFLDNQQQSNKYTKTTVNKQNILQYSR